MEFCNLKKLFLDGFGENAWTGILGGSFFVFGIVKCSPKVKMAFWDVVFPKMVWKHMCFISLFGVLCLGQ